MNIPKVFISYSHDSSKHKKWVLDLAVRLRKNGIDAIIDQWELGPGGDIPSFMEEHVKNSDYVLIVCTDEYVKKANSGVGGVGYEKMIITSDLMKKIDSKKVIPIIRQNGTKNVPTFIETKLFLDFSYDKDFEFNYDELVRTIHKSPVYEKPKIGSNPFDSSEDIAPKKSNNALKKLMSKIIKEYESGRSYSYLSDLNTYLRISRILFELLVKEAKDNGLIEDYTSGTVILTNKGKFYAVDNDLIKN